MINRWDPMRPDGRYTLDLSVWEDRVVAHVLTQLAVAEPGENWVGELTLWSLRFIFMLFTASYGSLLDDFRLFQPTNWRAFSVWT